jgi:hypothetical protein
LRGPQSSRLSKLSSALGLCYAHRQLSPRPPPSWTESTRTWCSRYLTGHSSAADSSKPVFGAHRRSGRLVLTGELFGSAPKSDSLRFTRRRRQTNRLLKHCTAAVSAQKCQAGRCDHYKPLGSVRPAPRAANPFRPYGFMLSGIVQLGGGVCESVSHPCRPSHPAGTGSHRANGGV